MDARILMGCACALVFSLGAQAAEAPSPPKPGAEHAKLGYFVGKWRAEGEMKDGPMGAGGKFASDDNCEWFAGKFSVICHGDMTGPMGRTKAVGILGYSAEEQVYTYYGVDSQGMVPTTVGRGTRNGDTWTYTDEAKMGGKLVKSRYTIKENSPTSYGFKWEVQGDDGKWTALMEGTETKLVKTSKAEAEKVTTAAAKP